MRARVWLGVVAAAVLLATLSPLSLVGVFALQVAAADTWTTRAPVSPG